eukprot:SAG31_NODE_1753_length_7350_cov_1.885395_3_plen_177_part_00
MLQIRLELSPDGLLAFKTPSADRLESSKAARSVDVNDCSIRLPKSSRKGHPHALRLDTAEVTTAEGSGKGQQEAEKFICSFDSKEQLSIWMEKLNLITKVQPHADFDDSVRMLAEKTITASAQRIKELHTAATGSRNATEGGSQCDGAHWNLECWKCEDYEPRKARSLDALPRSRF